MLSEEGTSHTGKVDERQILLVLPNPPKVKHILADMGSYTALGVIRLPRRKKSVSHPGKSPRSSISW